MKLEALSTYPVVRLVDVLTLIENGSRPSGGVDQFLEGIPSLGGEHLEDKGSFAFTNIKYVPTDFFERMSKGIIQKHDILIVKDGATTGKVAFVGDDFPYVTAAINEHVFLLRTEIEIILPEFLFFFLFSSWGQSQILRSFQGAAIGGINQDFINRVQIPLPTLPEQQRIVTILRHAADLRRQRREADEPAQNLLPALFNDMFGTPNEWAETERLEKCVDFVGGGTPSRKVEKYFTGTIPWATSKDIKARYLDDAQEHITDEAIQNSSTNLVPAGSILVVVKSKILVHTLPMAIITRPFCFGQDLKAMICKEGNFPQFIVAGLLAQARSILGSARGANTEGLTLEILRKIPMPKVSPEQQALFVQRVKQYDEIENQHQDSDKQMDGLFNSLLSRAFTGELTTTWREQHHDEILEPTKKRDEWLRERGHRARPTLLPTEEILIPTLLETHPRYPVLRELQNSQEQWQVYQAAAQSTAPFTVNGLAEQCELPVATVRRNLALLEALGIVGRAHYPLNISEQAQFAPLFVLLSESDDVRLGDLARLQNDFPETAQPTP